MESFINVIILSVECNFDFVFWFFLSSYFSFVSIDNVKEELSGSFEMINNENEQNEYAGFNTSSKSFFVSFPFLIFFKIAWICFDQTNFIFDMELSV